MEISWSTFLLEIINFLILIWILKHFFYKPVLNVIDRRKTDIESTLNKAKTLHEAAEKLQKKYENRLADWEKERQLAQQNLNQEIATERVQRIEKLQATLQQEQEKRQASERRRVANFQLQTEQTALTQAARFAAKLLSSIASPELEKHLLELTLKQLPEISARQLDALHSATAEKATKIMIKSAYLLDINQRQELESALTTLLEITPAFEYSQDRGLLAGIRITIGAWVLRANLQDELQGFTDLVQ